MIGTELKNQWSLCLDFIRDNVSKAVFDTWFSVAEPVSLEDGELLIQIPSPFVYEYLEQNCGRVCSRSELLKQVWKFDFLGDERTVDVTIKRTRQKIEPDQKNFKYILTRRGFGYFFPNDLT